MARRRRERRSVPSCRVARVLWVTSLPVVVVVRGRCGRVVVVVESACAQLRRRRPSRGGRRVGRRPWVGQREARIGQT